MESTAKEADIVVVGGGTVGLALAIDVLQSTNLVVAVVEAHSIDAGALAQSEHPSLDARCLALATTSYTYLRQLVGNPVDAAEQSGFALDECPIEHIQVSDRGFVGKCYLHAEDLHASQLGMVAPIQTIGRALFKRFQQLQTEYPARLIWCNPNTVDHIEQQQSQTLLTLDNSQQLSAKLVVFADGGRSAIKHSVGFGSINKDYQQTAIIANVVCEQPHQNWAFERFTKTGPLALLPLNSSSFEESESQGIFSLVWTVNSDDSGALQRLSNDDNYFLAALTEYAGQRHGRFIKTSERNSYPLHLTYAEQVAQHRCVVIGNAAQALHPIAGQGFNLGLRDVEALTNLIKATVYENKPELALGNWRFTQQYRQSRKADRDLIINATDSLVHCFSNHHWPLVIGRNAGLLMMNKLGPFKHYFARRAMGY